MLAAGSRDRWLQVRRFGLLVRLFAPPPVLESAHPPFRLFLWLFGLPYCFSCVLPFFRPSVLPFLSSSVFRASRTPVLWFFSFPGLAYCRSLFRWNANSPELRYFGTQILRNADSLELRYFGTQILWYSDPPELRVTGTQILLFSLPSGRSDVFSENSLNTEFRPYRDTHSLALHWLNSFSVKMS